MRRRPPARQCESKERQLEVLLTNDLVGNQQYIADAILKHGVYMHFCKGDKLIEENNSDDCAYFILAGDVCFIVNGRNIGGCSAPRTVGELTANNPAKRRTADVIVTTPIVETLRIAGTRFREIRDAFPSFKQRLADMIEAMNREKIAQTGKVNTKNQTWLLVSIATATLCAIVSGLVAFQLGQGVPLIICAVIVGAALGLVVCSLLNPEYWYRRVSAISSFSLIALILYGGISLTLTAGNEEGSKWLLDFSNSSELTQTHFFISCFFLLIVAALNAFADFRTRR
jgi:hypothetical protein